MLLKIWDCFNITYFFLSVWASPAPRIWQILFLILELLNLSNKSIIIPRILAMEKVSVENYVIVHLIIPGLPSINLHNLSDFNFLSKPLCRSNKSMGSLNCKFLQHTSQHSHALIFYLPCTPRWTFFLWSFIHLNSADISRLARKLLSKFTKCL